MWVCVIRLERFGAILELDVEKRVPLLLSIRKKVHLGRQVGDDLMPDLALKQDGLRWPVSTLLLVAIVEIRTGASNLFPPTLAKLSSCSLHILGQVFDCCLATKSKET